METTNNNIKIVRLQSGEDIIANYYTDEESSLVLLDRPMHVIFKRLPTGKTIMMMMPWLPLELIKENNALIDLSDVLTVLEPREELVSYYIQIAVNSDVLIGDQEIGESLIGDEDDEEENLSVEELQELMKEQKKHQLH